MTLPDQLAALAAARADLGRSLRETSAWLALERFVGWLDDQLTRRATRRSGPPSS